MAAFTYLASGPTKGARPCSLTARLAFDRLLDLMLDQGQFPLQQLARQFEDGGEALRALVEQGYLRHASPSKLDLSLSSVRAAEERMLLELFRLTGSGLVGQHRSTQRGTSPEVGEETKPWCPGEPIEHVDVSETLRNAALRGLPLRLREEDVAVRPGESSVRCAAVLLLDLSGSMARHGKFPAARRAALALRALVRQRFPGDELITIGFATRAVPLPGRALLEVMPRSVGLFDPDEASMRVPANSPSVPEHFTNIQEGLRLARQALRNKSHSHARQVLLITDGEPTAHRKGQELVLAYPTLPETVSLTLAEAGHCARSGITLSVFGLVSEFSAPGLRDFVQRLANAGRGTSLCCTPRQLGRCLLDRFVRARTPLRLPAGVGMDF